MSDRVQKAQLGLEDLLPLPPPFPPIPWWVHKNIVKRVAPFLPP